MSETEFHNPFTADHESESQTELEAVAQRLRALIASQPPKELLGYLYSGLLLQSMGRVSVSEDDEVPSSGSSAMPRLGIDDAQFLLEYVHAVFASTQVQSDARLDETTCAEIVQVAAELKGRSHLLAMMIAAGSSDAQFGPETNTLIFQALSNWILLRGHRYQVLEEEFFRFVLQPHDDALRRVYGAGASDIAEGIQALANAIRVGHMNAAVAVDDSMEDAHRFLTEQGKTLEEGMDDWKAERPERVEAAQAAFVDLFHGGICCVSRHTTLPPLLLDDLSYAPAEETDFFAPGPYSGTPFRTLPARKKPLIKLDGEHYLTDPSFARDAAYRAILHNLLCREPSYKDEFNARQKAMSETAFETVLARQLNGAQTFNEVYYRHGGNWFENDTLVLLDDALILVEAKSGAAATIASPANDFERHARDVRDLIVKAYEQCRRFLEYLSSADEVPLFKLKNGRYEEILRIRLADYRLVLPVGLTVESYSPFSTGSKKLPGLGPILGRHPFISVAIDELMVLDRFLPTTGELMHYLRIRQEAAGLQNGFLFDELDHLGAYITRNRFPDDIREELANGADMLVLNGMSDVIDEYFSQPDWEQKVPPSQTFPDEMKNLLTALDRTRAPGWIEIDGHLRDYGSDGRNNIASILEPLRESLHAHPSRYFVIQGDPAVLFWLHRDSEAPDLLSAMHKAHVAALASGMERLIVVTIGVDPRGHYGRVTGFWAESPKDASPEVRAEAAAIKKRTLAPKTASAKIAVTPSRKQGRNEPCSCGSGIKFKKCHGR